MIDTDCSWWYTNRQNWYTVVCILIEYIILYGIIFHEYHYIRISVLTDPRTDLLTNVALFMSRHRDPELYGMHLHGSIGAIVISFIQKSWKFAGHLGRKTSKLRQDIFLQATSSVRVRELKCSFISTFHSLHSFTLYVIYLTRSHHQLMITNSY